MSTIDFSTKGTLVRIGMVGSDFLHALEYASLINAPIGPRPAKPPVDHSAEVGGMPPPTHGRPDAWSPPVVTGDIVRSTSAFSEAHVVLWWGPDRLQVNRWAEQAAVPDVADSVAEMVGRVDAALICTRSGKGHRELARPFLEAGIPVFIDKPLAESVAEARDLVALAEDRGTFLFTSSPWRWSPAVSLLREDQKQLGNMHACIVAGPDIDGPYFYAVHLVETALALFGPGVERVRAEESRRARTITGHYPDGRVLQLIGLKEASAIRTVMLIGDNGHMGCDIIDSQRDAGMFHMLDAFLRSVRDAEPVEPHSVALETISLLDAAAAAVKDGKIHGGSGLRRSEWSSTLRADS